MSARKRFWRDVDVVQQAGLFTPRLDGRSIRLPEGAVLAVASLPLAEAIATEWREIADGASFTPEDLPLTRMAGTMIERIRPDPGTTRAALLRYGMDDELCYRGTAHREAGVTTILSWAAAQGLQPAVSNSLMPVCQPEAYRLALRGVLENQDEVALTALGVIVPVSGSALLGLCVTSGAIEVPDACAVACADEEHQLAVWGQDTELQATINRRAEDIGVAMRYLALSRH